MRLINKDRASGSTNAGEALRTTPRSPLIPKGRGDTAEPRRSKAGATSSPSNTIRTAKNTMLPHPRPSGGTPKGFPSKTPRA
jgi:hypothetical protein